jgi:site-specific DNA-methyltransferase (adenine-specific)
MNKDGKIEKCVIDGGKIEDFIDNVHLGKWEQIIPFIPSNSVDIIITSPPYNVNLGKNRFKKDAYDTCEDNMPYDDYLKWMDNLFNQCYRVLKTSGRIAINIGDGSNGSIMTHCDFSVRMRDIHKFIPITTIVWNKKQIGGSTSWGSYQSPSNPSFPTPFEFIIVMAKETRQHLGEKSKITVSGKDFQRNSRSLWEFPPETQMMKLYDHPAMFPSELPRRLIDQLTYEEDIVLDPFSGAGTTCAVAKEMKRHYIGIEMSEKYYNTSLERLAKIPSTERTEVDGKEVNVPAWMTEA